MEDNNSECSRKEIKDEISRELVSIINSSSTEPISDSFGADIPDVELFVRKVKEEQIFDDFLERRISENTICIWGFGGVGKSALLTLFANSALKNNNQVIYGSMRSHNLTSFILFYAGHLGLNPEEYSSDHMVCNFFLESIQKQTIIFIDDYPETKESDALTNWLIDETNKRRNTKLLFVLACRRRPTFSPTSPISYIGLLGMDKTETEKFITSSVNQDSNWIKETAEHVKKIYSRTKGNPKIIELLCKNQHAWVFFKENPTIQLHTIEEINLLFKEIWSNIGETTRKSAQLLATCIQISPYISGGLIRDLIPDWESEINNLLDLSILKKIGIDNFSLHDLFKDYIYKEHLGDIERQKCHNKLGSYYKHNHQIENRNMYTLIHFVEAKSLHDVIQIYDECIKTMDNISNINLVKDLEVKILTLNSESYGGIQNNNDFECDVLMNLAEHNRVLSEYGAAISNFEKALKLTKPLEFYKLAICNIGMGDVYRRMGKYEDAIDHYWSAFNMCKSDDVLAAKAYTGLGAAYNMLCNYSEAYGFHSKAEKLYQNDKKGIGRNLRGQAASLNLKGNCNDALQKYSDAKKIYESEFIDERGMAYAFWGIGESYRMIENYQEALTNFEVAIEKVKSIGDVWAETYINLNLGELYRSNRELPEAEKKYITAMELATRKYAYVEYAYSKLGIAETKRLQGIFDNGIYEEVIKAFKENDSCWGIVHSFIGMALAQFSQGDLKSFEENINQAREVCNQNNMVREIQLIEKIETKPKGDFLHAMNFP